MRLHLLVSRGYDEEHKYDIGTREVHGFARQKGERPRFLEDFIDDYDYVKILETGGEYYRCEPSAQQLKKESQTQ